MFCTNCGKKSENDADVFCPFCGAKYEKQITVTEKKPQSELPKVFCMNCGKKSENDADVFCPFCGSKYGEVAEKTRKDVKTNSNIGDQILLAKDKMASKSKEDLEQFKEQGAEFSKRIFTKKNLKIAGIIVGIVALIGAVFYIYNVSKDKKVLEEPTEISEQTDKTDTQNDSDFVEEPEETLERTVGGPVLQEDIDFILDREVFGYIDSYPTLYSSNYPTILELYHRGDKLGKIFNDKNFEIKEDTWKYTSVEEGNYAIKFKARDWQYGEAWEVDFNYVSMIDGDKYPSISYATNMKDGADSMYFCIDSYTGDFGNIEYAYRACDAEASAMLYIAYGGNAEIQNILDTYSDYIIPDSSTRLLSESELYGLDQDTLKLARNEIYARHGYIFKSDELMSYFSAKSWYVPQYDSDQDVYAQLNDIEKQKLDMIKSMEQ